MDCSSATLLALPAGAARVLERRRATSRSLIVETIGLCHAWVKGRLPAVIRAPGSAVGTSPFQILPTITSVDADDLKRTQLPADPRTTSS